MEKEEKNEQPTKRIKQIFFSIQEQLPNIHIDENEVTAEVTIKLIHLLAKKIKDPRRKKSCTYDYHKLLVIVLFAMIKGYRTAGMIAFYCRLKQDFFVTNGLLEKNQIPSHDTIRRHLMILDPAEVNDALVTAIGTFINKIEKRTNFEGQYQHIAIDGKENCGSGRKSSTLKPKSNINIMNVFNISHQTCVYSLAIDSKTNEIPVGQTLVNKMYLKGTILTCDDLNSTRALAKIITKKKGDYVMTIKNEVNKKELLIDMRAKIDESLPAHVIKQVSAKVTRRYWFYHQPRNRKISHDWAGAQTYVMYENETISSTGVVKTTKLFFISSLSDEQAIIEAIESRWDIENGLHRYKDLLLNEDGLVYTNRNMANNLACINNAALTIIKLAKGVLGAPSNKGAALYLTSEPEEEIMKTLYMLGSNKVVSAIVEKLNSKKN